MVILHPTGAQNPLEIKCQRTKPVVSSNGYGRFVQVETRRDFRVQFIPVDLDEF